VCVQDDLNGQKIIGLPSAALDRLSPLVIIKNIFLAVNGMYIYVPSLMAGGNPILNLPCFTRP
jgi:hypothetical protein